MHVFVLGLDHHTSPVEIRERVAFRPSQFAAAFEELRADVGLREAAILSTCNRVEIYVVADDDSAVARAIDWLHTFHALPAHLLDDVLYCHADGDTVQHLFATVSGMNSLIVGETQIQRQVREAATHAAAQESLGPILHALFRHALEVGKRVRTETSIDRHAASVSQAGVELARAVFGDLQDAHVLLVGSGKVSELAAKNLLDNGARTITLVNRTLDHACRLAQQWGGHAMPFEELQQAIDAADIVISSTAAPHTVIHRQHVQSARSVGGQRPLILIDLAVPRDVDTDVLDEPDVHLYNVDDLQSVVLSNIDRRRGEFAAVEAIVAEERDAFLRWLSARAVVPTLTGLRAHAERIRQDEVSKALRRMGPLSDRDQQIIEALSQGIVNKLLHQPTVRLKARSANSVGLQYAQVVQELFGLEQADA